MDLGDGYMGSRISDVTFPEQEALMAIEKAIREPKFEIVRDNTSASSLQKLAITQILKNPSVQIEMFAKYHLDPVMTKLNYRRREQPHEEIQIAVHYIALTQNDFSYAFEFTRTLIEENKRKNNAYLLDLFLVYEKIPMNFISEQRAKAVRVICKKIQEPRPKASDSRPLFKPNMHELTIHEMVELCLIGLLDDFEVRKEVFLKNIMDSVISQCEFRRRKYNNQEACDIIKTVEKKKVYAYFTTLAERCLQEDLSYHKRNFDVSTVRWAYWILSHYEPNSTNHPTETKDPRRKRRRMN